MIGSEKIVVNRLRNTHDAAVITGLLHILGDLVAGIHGVVSAVVEEIADIVLLENFKNALVVGLVNICVGKLIAAGTEIRGRRVLKKFKLGRIFLSYVVELLVQYSDDTVGGTVNFLDYVGVLECLDKDTGGGSINDGSRTTGLSKHQITF